MGWVRWPSGKEYYERRRVRDGKVVWTYCGTGERGRAAEEEDKDELAELKRIRAEAWEMTDMMCDHEAILNLIVRKVMAERGFVWRSAKWRRVENLKRKG